MSRKTKLSTEKLKVDNKTFLAKSVPYQVLDENALIAKALEADSVNQKEKALLERELEKPFNKRNKALVNKYRGVATEVLNGWPDDVSKGGYTITATAVDDGDIPIESRPMPWYSNITLTNNGNNYNFKFPLKREVSNDGAEIYKIDGMQTWIFRDGTVVDSLSEDVTPYTILMDYVKSGKSDAIEKFPNFLVKYTREEKKDSDKKAENKAEKPSKGNLQQFTEREGGVPILVGEVSVASAVLTMAGKSGVSIGSVSPTIKDLCVVDEIAVGKKPAHTWLYFRGADDEGIYATLLSGAGVAAAYLGKKSLTISSITEIIEKHNKTIRAQL